MVSLASAPPTTVAPAPPVAPDDARRLETEAGSGWAVTALFAFALVVGAYFTFRFGGRWAEADTAGLAANVRSIMAYQTILPWNGYIYPNGYGFGVVSSFVIAFIGVDVATLMQLVYPMVSASLVVIAWPLYRELTGSGRAATLATLLLFVQPEFLFVILRGSHERVLRALLLVSLLLLVRSFRHAEQTRLYGSYVSLFYLAVFGIIATNSLFASSYIWAIGVALVGSWFGAYLGPRFYAVSVATRRRLIYAPILCALLIFLFNDYIYPPSGFGLSQLPSILERLQQLLLTTSTEGGQPTVQAYDPYAVVLEQWIDPKVYFLLSSGTFGLMIGSAILWTRTGLRWLANKGERPTLGQWLLWLLYAAFALQGALSIVADRAGMLGGNLQHRSFPSFVVAAAPVVAMALVRMRLTPIRRALVAGGLGVLALLALLKATNEPALSNKWTFYLPAELTAVSFANEHVKDAGYWADFDERLRSAQTIAAPSERVVHIGPARPSVRTYLVTDVVRLRAARLGRPLPPVGGELRVYDNGAAQIYRSRARTPYQD